MPHPPKKPNSAAGASRYNRSVRPEVREKMNSWLPLSPATVALWPSFAGESFFPRNYWITHPHFERLGVQIVLGGELIVRWDDDELVLREGEAAVVPPGAHTLATGRAGFCRKLCFGIQGLVLRILAQTFGLNRVLRLPKKQLPEITAYYGRFAALLAAKSYDSVTELSELAYSALMLLARGGEPVELPPELIRCRQYIEPNIHSRITVAELSAAAAVTPGTLCRLFKRHLQTTPLAYIIGQRLTYASHLLSDEHLLLKEVAHLCGYKNQLYFSNDFRKRFGVSPKHYRFNSN